MLAPFSICKHADWPSWVSVSRSCCSIYFSSIPLGLPRLFLLNFNRVAAACLRLIVKARGETEAAPAVVPVVVFNLPGTLRRGRSMLEHQGS